MAASALFILGLLAAVPLLALIGAGLFAVAYPFGYALMRLDNWINALATRRKGGAGGA